MEWAKTELSETEYFQGTFALECDTATVERAGFCESSPANQRSPSGWHAEDEVGGR